MSATPNNSATIETTAAEAETTSQEQQQQQLQQVKHKRCCWKNVLGIVAILLALLLVIAAIYMHLRQRHHLGRLNFEPLAAQVELQMVTAPTVAELSKPSVSDACLVCIAAAATANKPAMCGVVPCGIYRISRPYWQDAWRAASSIGSEDYESCVSSVHCASASVRGYIESYAQDCDGDGRIQCRDHVMLHLLGPTGCLTRSLDPLAQTRMAQCLTLKALQ